MTGEDTESSLCLPGPSNLKRKPPCSTLPLVPEKKLKISDLSSFVVKTSSSQKEVIDCHVAKYFYATNTSFRSVENNHFKKLMDILRPGYFPPSKLDLSGKLLNKVYESEMEKCHDTLKNQTLCMSLDGWSNVHNQPIICICVTTMEGNVYLVDTIDTSGTPHTGENLTDLAVTAIKNIQDKFNCRIRSFVTDNAANMASMRKALKTKDCIEVVCYGCSAHILSLLSKDLEIQSVTEHVVQINKYFRNNQFARAKFNESKGNKSVGLSLPSQVRWNTMCDSLESYIKNWPILMQIVDENRDAIDESIRSKVMNLSIKRNVEDLLLRLKPISIALDQIQKDSCSIAEAVDIWKKLETDLKKNKVLDNCKKSVINKSFKNRYDQALTPVHFLAYLLSPTFRPDNLSTEEKNNAIQFIKENYEDEDTSLLTILLKFIVRAEPFNGPLFEDKVVNKVDALHWWKSLSTLKDCISSKELLVIEQLMTAKATSAGVERIFSTFGFVHSKLRNQLGVEKAAKLAFLFKSLNK